MLEASEESVSRSNWPHQMALIDQIREGLGSYHNFGNVVVIDNLDNSNFEGAVVKTHYRSRFKRKWEVEALRYFAIKRGERDALLPEG